MSDLAATNCGNGCGCANNGNNDCCNLIFLILLISCVCNNGNVDAVFPVMAADAAITGCGFCC